MPDRVQSRGQAKAATVTATGLPAQKQLTDYRCARFLYRQLPAVQKGPRQTFVSRARNVPVKLTTQLCFAW